MICKHCSTEIADKALICYRCGNPTTEAKFKPPEPRRTAPSLVPSVLLVAIAVCLAGYLQLYGASDNARYAGWIAAALAVIVVVARAYKRRL